MTPIRVCVVVENHPAVLMGGAQYQAHLLAQALSEKEDVAVTYLARKAPCEVEASTCHTVWNRSAVPVAAQVVAFYSSIRMHCGNN